MAVAKRGKSISAVLMDAVAEGLLLAAGKVIVKVVRGGGNPDEGERGT